MRWLWRFLTILVVLGLLRTAAISQPKIFIGWQDRQNWPQLIQTQMRQLQMFTQDLPESLEVEVHRFWRDFRTNAEGKEV